MKGCCNDGMDASAQPSPRDMVLSRLFRDYACYWIVVVVVAFAAIFYYRAPGSLGFPLDDGYISLHSAQVLHWGQDPNFAGVPALAGITNAPFVALIWIFLIWLPPLGALHTVCWLGILWYGLGVVALCRAHQLSPAATVGVGIVSIATGRVTFHLLNGVETGMALGLTCCLLAAKKRNTIWSRRMAALLCGLAPFVRPELAALSILILANFAWEDYSEQRNISRAIQHTMPLVLIAALLAAPWILWYWINTGTPIPQSIEAKRVFFAEGCAPALWRWNMTISAIGAFISVVGLLSLALIFLVRSALGKCTLVFVPLFFLAYYERLPGALFHNLGRYTYLLMPVLLLGMVVGLADRALWLRRSAYALLVLTCLQSSVTLPGYWRQFTVERDTYTAALSSVADWTVRHVPPNAVLLIHDAGYISYAARFRMADLVGLKTPSSIAFNRIYNYGTCGVGRPFAVNQIALAAEPDYLIILNDWDRFYHITAALNAMGWHEEERFENSKYRIYRLSPPINAQKVSLLHLAP